MTRYDPPKGTPPTLEFVQLPVLNVDATYQRTIETKESRALIGAIAAHWDWRLCSPLVVSRRLPYGAQGAPMLFVIDGQHRLEAARQRQDIPFLPCIVTSYTDAAEEAALFVAVNKRRRSVSPLETFRAALVAGDEEAATVVRLIKASGLTLARSGSPSGWKAGELGQVGTVVKGLRKHGEPIVSAALTQLAEAFPDEVLEQAGRILTGLFLVHAEPPAGFDPDRLFQALLLRDQAQWAAAAMARIASVGEFWPTAMRGALLEIYETITVEATA